MGKKKKKEKKPVLLKTKEERLTEIIEVIKKLNNLGLNDTIPGIKEFKTILKEFVQNGESCSGKIKLTTAKRIIIYSLPKTKGRNININLKYDGSI